MDARAKATGASRESCLTLFAPSRNSNAVLLGLGLAVVAAVAAATLGRIGWPDYFHEAQPAVQALIRGHWGSFLQLAPAYGGSLLIRSPILLAGHALGAGPAGLYRGGAVFCLLVAAGLALWVAGLAPTRYWPGHLRLPGSTLTKAAVLLVCLANPAVFEALHWGHPEEILGAALAVAAVLAALGGRAEAAGLLLGLAVANKQWALIAGGPVLVALPDRRLRALIWAMVTAAVLLGPFALAGGAAGQTVGQASGSTFQRWQLWWFFGSPGHPIPGQHVAAIGYRSAPPWLSPIAHPLIVALTVPLTVAYVWVRRHRSGHRLDPLLLLALLLLLRCALDPWDISYYPVPFVLALTIWESLRYSRPPVLAAISSAAVWFSMQGTVNPALGLSTDAQALIFISFVLVGTALLSLAVFRPRPGSKRSPIPAGEPRALAAGV